MKQCRLRYRNGSPKQKKFNGLHLIAHASALHCQKCRPQWQAREGVGGYVGGYWATPRCDWPDGHHIIKGHTIGADFQWTNGHLTKRLRFWKDKVYKDGQVNPRMVTTLKAWLSDTRAEERKLRPQKHARNGDNATSGTGGLCAERL